MGGLGNKKIMSQNIQHYMRLHNKTRNEMCEALGVKYTTFTDWVNGNTYPRIDKIELMANFFKIEKSDLVEDRSVEKRKKVLRVPVLGRIPAGVPIEAIEEIIDYEEMWYQPGEFFALLVQGDSMLPDLKNNDVVIIRKQADADSGDVVAVLVNGYDATIKKLKKRPEGIMLIPNNSSYDTMFYSNREVEELPISIIGKVVELRRKF